MSGNGEQLVSFFIYSLFVYPVTNYIVAPQRKYPKWKAALYAVLFLLAISIIHVVCYLIRFSLWFEYPFDSRIFTLLIFHFHGVLN